MNFLNPLFLLGLTTLIGPILIHLIRKDDSQKILFSSIIFVKAAPLKSWKHQTVSNWPLLLLRILGILLLILGFARPYLTSMTAHSLQLPGSRSVVVLLDNSFSMRLGDHFEKGKEIAEKIINGISDRDTLQMAFFSDTVQVLNQPAQKSKDLSSELVGVGPSFRKSDYVSSLQYASHQMFLTSGTASRELHLISDFQESGWNPHGELRLNEGVQIVPHDVADLPVANLSVNSPRYELDSNRDAHFSVQVASCGKRDSESITINLFLNEKLVQEQTLLLKPGEARWVEFTKVSLPSEIRSGRFSLRSSDQLKEDDQCYFSVSPQKPYRILILSDRVHPDNLYLSSALAAGTESVFQMELSNAERAVASDLSRYSAIVLNNVSTLPSAYPSLLESYVQQGGKLWVILGSRTDIHFFNSAMSRLLPATLMRKQTSDKRAVKWHVAKVENRHRAFEIFSPTHLSQFRSISFSGRILCQPREGTQALASFDDGQPLLLETTIGKGSSWLYCSSVHPDWSDFPFDPLFVPFVQQIARDLININDAKKSYSVGDSLPLALLNPQFMKGISLIAALTDSFTHNWKVISPSGKPIDLKGKSLDSFLTVEEQGFYATRVQNVDHIVAVNIDPGESKLEAFDPNVRFAALQRSGGGRMGSGVTGRGLREDPLQVEGRQGIGPILLALALVVFIMESLLSYHFDQRRIRSHVGIRGER